jgi:hypothetical protein
MTNQTATFEIKQRTLTLGNWSVTLRGDELADVIFGNHIVLRSLRAVIRDSDWNTANLVVEDESVADDAIRLKVSSEGYGSSFEGTVELSVVENTAQFVIDLISKRQFRSNRTGIIVLHSPLDSGSEALVIDPDANSNQKVFPEAIDPNQPMENIQSLKWSRGNFQTTLSFDGEVFETEDQRNWTDASFKTYSRPLSQPFPYEIKAGERVRQSVKISVQGDFSDADNGHTSIRLDKTITAPRFALLASNAKDPAPKFDELGSSVCLELNLSTSNWKAALDRAKASKFPIDLRLVIGAEQGEAEILEAIHHLAGHTILTVAAFDKNLHVTTDETQRVLREALKRASINIKLVAGARSHFTELNRNQGFPRESLSAVCFSSTPMFHSRDTAQLIESVAMQRLTVINAVRIAAGAPLHVGPVTLRPRFNNVATTAQPGPSRSDLLEGYGAEFTDASDPRQGAKELAAWSIASFCAFAIEHVELITWFEQWGPRGVVDSEGRPYPVLAAMKILSEIAGQEILIADSPNNLIWAIGVREKNQLKVIASNLNDHGKDFEVSVGGITKTLTLEAFSYGVFELN